MIHAVQYNDDYENLWDRFVNEEAVNGTFLQTRNFLNYHPKGRFIDHSLLLLKDNAIVAVVPGCVIDGDLAGGGGYNP
jgi:hypothetical protein